MNTQNNVLVGIVMLVVGFGLGYLLTSAGKDNMPAEHTMTVGSMMDSMISGLEGKTGDDFDKAFIEGMIVHHQGAVAMAESAKVNAKHQEIKTLADAIIKAQTEEITTMQTWLKSWYGEEPGSKNGEVISQNGIHWHPILDIYVKGEKQVIPANIGIGAQYASNPTFDKQMGMTAVHTHDDANQGVIHFEFNGVVKESDLTLGKFLEIWGKDINSFGSKPQMTVNGVNNTKLSNYSMKDADKIELRYE